VADRPELLEIVARRRPGIQPTILFFAALHHLVLRHSDEDLAAWYPSVVGDDARPADGAGPAFLAFCAAHHDELDELVRTRMVQTNVVRRSTALRFALAVVAQRSSEPVHLVEVGTSAGIHLRQDRFRIRLGDQVSGPADPALELVCEWRGDGPPPDLSIQPTIASATGVDLHPVDARSEEDRRWLRALVWPENLAAAAELEAALRVVADDPPRMLTGDIVDLAPQLDRELDGTRVVFHAATRGHVPPDRRAAFDDAIAALGTGGPLAHVAMETPHRGEPRSASSDPHHVLTLTWRDEPPAALAYVEAHAAWIEPATPP
jgi:hypothetical protein